MSTPLPQTSSKLSPAALSGLRWLTLAALGFTMSLFVGSLAFEHLPRESR